ncbi:hypothetical protein [Cellulomonas fimi]|uniref:Uncharacterized protein n=1 Tax=Cellulomonas fimi (strain ATCC 484 / DSM 20113 / JCM 1341 / CCUG 24087 / LMG 16345 / NBRC 15513 / NCIMB 8980 / NCTC 7547 / NRS-133) TaxID=590998 RepID=F4H6X9_CELFA|nr:hypothetical protein [Cellulomonas fimi]AEE44488.1 hypothetical protein Celf_0343 [Cellulomonas fimi ATCC 484]NNH06613.1 hypothetical protein [Cellulomonas fimi]VEH26460.1 Uncharacterised protein [Cellulomonas fimi]
MRFVVLRFATSTPPEPAAAPFLDLAPPWPAAPATNGPPDGSRASAPGTDPAPGARDRHAADLLSDALERDLASVRTLRDDLATLAAVLGVTTVLDEALGSPDVATTIRSRAEGLSLTDGAATTADGPLVGLHVLDAPDLDALVDVLTLLPAGTFEVHPVVAA